ncbi:MAG: hypothetical protein ACOZNI_07935 [Myxococcota bacterium]
MFGAIDDQPVSRVGALAPVHAARAPVIRKRGSQRAYEFADCALERARTVHPDVHLGRLAGGEAQLCCCIRKRNHYRLAPAGGLTTNDRVSLPCLCSNPSRM